jgi:hypothetical protein
MLRLVSLLVIFSAGCSQLKCGAGTTERNGACVIATNVTADAGTSDASTHASDAATHASDGAFATTGAPYTAYRAGGGPTYGDDGTDYVFCKPGDNIAPRAARFAARTPKIRYFATPATTAPTPRTTSVTTPKGWS